MDEMFPLVDINGVVVGKATRASCHNGSMWLHPVVHLHVFTSTGRLHLQKRPMHKDIQPGKWDTAVGGHVDWGETIEEALHREAFEEIGLRDFTPHKLSQYLFRSAQESELVHSFYTFFDGPLFPEKNELEDERLWEKDEIQESMDEGIFTPNFEFEYNQLLKKIWPKPL